MVKTSNINNEDNERLRKITDNSIFLTLSTVNELLKELNGSDAIALYVFYYKNAKIQKTNQVWSTNEFCMKGLHWGERKLLNAKQTLIEHDLIEIIKTKKPNGQLNKQYVKIKYKWSQNKESKVIKHLKNQELENFHNPQNPGMENEGTNAYNKRNKYLHKENNEKGIEINSSLEKQSLGTNCVLPNIPLILQQQPIPNTSETVKNAINTFFKYYRTQTNQEHPWIKLDQMQRVINNMERFEKENSIEYEWEEIIQGYFKKAKLGYYNQKEITCDYNINHFSNYNGQDERSILSVLFYEVVYTNRIERLQPQFRNQRDEEFIQ